MHFAHATVFLHIPGPQLHLLLHSMFKTRLNPWCSGYPEASCQPHPGRPVIKFWLVDIYILWATGGNQDAVSLSSLRGSRPWCPNQCLSAERLGALSLKMGMSFFAFLKSWYLVYCCCSWSCFFLSTLSYYCMNSLCGFGVQCQFTLFMCKIYSMY